MVRLMAAALGIVLACGPAGAQPAPGKTIYGVTASGQIVAFKSTAPGRLMRMAKTVVPGAAERITGIDFRPSDKQLYALSNQGKLYTVDTATGALTPVTTLAAPLAGAAYGVDFNPVPDRLRVTNDARQNLRANPADGMTAKDKPLAYAAGDANSGAAPAIAASAYTNNFAGTKATTLYNIDYMRDTLVTQNPPNDGILNTVGALGVKTTPNAGLDIASPAEGTNTAFAALQAEGERGSALYTVDLGTGAATLVGKIGGTEPLAGIAVALD